MEESFFAFIFLCGLNEHSYPVYGGSPIQIFFQDTIPYFIPIVQVNKGA